MDKFAIRPNTRNHDTLNRDVIIKTVADAVQRMGSSHSVNLKHYDCLILVEVYRVSQSPQSEILARFDCSAYKSSLAERMWHECCWLRVRKVEALQLVGNLRSIKVRGTHTKERSIITLHMSNTESIYQLWKYVQRRGMDQRRAFTVWGSQRAGRSWIMVRDRCCQKITLSLGRTADQFESEITMFFHCTRSKAKKRAMTSDLKATARRYGSAIVSHWLLDPGWQTS